ncbi:MAG: tripartite tricarboxylate transporter TctB family protein [Chloroflexi bacterium]|nr:tripartite tricarboxylate transporter TctB family protein [Chloroflexota bacterium]
MKAEKIASLASTALAATYLIGAFFIKEPPLRQQLGPEAFPKAIGVLMLFLALLYVRQQFQKQPIHDDEERAAIIGAEEKLGGYVDYKTIGIMLVLMLAYGFAFEPLGYPLATLLMFTAGIFVLDRNHLTRDLIIALIASFGIYFLFRYALRVNLPIGILSFLFR